MPRKVFVAGEILTASDVNTNLMDQSVMVFDDATARATAIPTPVEGMVTYLKDTDVLEVFSGSAFVNFGSSAVASFRFVQTLRFESSGTFTKANFPFLRAIRVQCQAGGGGGGGSGSNNNAGGGGGGGGFAEAFITNIAGLADSVTITRGAGGAGGAVGNNNGTAGGTSSFGSLVSASGGGGGQAPPSPGVGVGGFAGVGTAGNLGFHGNDGSNGTSETAGTQPANNGGHGGGSHLGGGGRGGSNTQGSGALGRTFGGGGGGALRVNTSFAGGSGASGIVIIELFA